MRVNKENVCKVFSIMLIFNKCLLFFKCYFYFIFYVDVFLKFNIIKLEFFFYLVNIVFKYLI